MDNQLVEEHVLAVLSELLDAPELTKDDDFFEKGGHSLLVIRAVALLRQRHGLTIPAREFIANPRVGAIAAAATPV